MNAKLELVRAWLIKSQHDLGSAQKLSTGPDPYLDVAIYHCQQAAEKAVKGLLVFHDRPFEKTHDIEVLITLAGQYVPGLTSWVGVAIRLTPYATEYRYPGGLLDPTPAEFQQALEAATGLYDFVLSVLPPAVHP